MVIKRLGAQRFSGLEADVNNLPIDADLLGAIFNSTDTLKFWIFDGTTWNESAGGGGITGLNPDSTILEYLNSVPDVFDDYTTPDSAVVTSATGAPTFFDDFSTQQGWVEANSLFQVNTSAEVFDFNNIQSTTNYTAYFDLGTPLSDSIWNFRFKIDFDTLTTASSNWIHIGMSSVNGDDDATQDALMCRIQYEGLASQQTYTAEHADGGVLNGAGTNTANGTIVLGIKFVELIRDSPTSFTVNVFNDEFFSDLFATATSTVSAGITGLQFIKIQNRTSGSGGVIQGTIDDIEINDNSVLPSQGGADSAIDQDTATFWESQAGINESITVDMGSPVNCYGLAYFLSTDAGLTETQFQIIDDTTGRILRTINISDMTLDDWNFIRFNGVNTQFIKIEGSSGSSLVMSANELAVQIEPDPPLTTKHGQFTINGTDTSLPFNGGDPTTSVINDPVTNSMTLTSTVTQGDPPTDGMVMWNEILDANNSVSHSKMKIDGSIKDVRWF